MELMELLEQPILVTAAVEAEIALERRRLAGQVLSLSATQTRLNLQPLQQVHQP
jgi:hypothetical protein